MSKDRWSKIGRGVANVLGIQLDEPFAHEEHDAKDGHRYTYEEPDALDWIKDIIPTGRDVAHYFVRLFPFLQWIHRYNLQWALGDFIAGITIGAIIVPQGMSYAKLAELPPQYGLYSSFMGAVIYWIFATSKDVNIGPVAVMSKLVGEVVDKVWNAGTPPCTQNAAGDLVGDCFPPQIIAQALAVTAGMVICSLGLLRLGWLVDFIPLVAVSAFITGSALSIAVGQIPNLLGISVNADFNTRAQTYKVFIETLKNLPLAQTDAALGLTALFALYLWRFACNYMATRQPHRRKMWFLLSTIRVAIVLLIYIMISALCLLDYPRTSDAASEIATTHWAILGVIPRGFQAAGVPRFNGNIISKFAGTIPAAVIVLLIEHIAIAKSFGRVNNYTIDPSQELVAIGATNLLGPFLGGYPSTGSFSRTAVQSKAGVRTPLAGIVTGCVVLLAIYALPPVFFYIPNAGLAAVIIHAVGDLITPPNTVYQFWKISPLEVVIFLGGVIIIVFTTIEYGVYAVICSSLFLYLWRAIKAKAHPLGTVKVRSVLGHHYTTNGKGLLRNASQESIGSTRQVFLPLDKADGTNEKIHLDDPHPGILIFRFSEGFNYLNCTGQLEQILQDVYQKTRRTNPQGLGRPGDYSWSDYMSPDLVSEQQMPDNRPLLKAVILDFSNVSNVDVTAVQGLIDVRNQLDRYAQPSRVQWHFAYIKSPWTKRALTAAGFGYATDEDISSSRWKSIFSVAELRSKDGNNIHYSEGRVDDVDRSVTSSEADRSGGQSHSARNINAPFFHDDLTSALQAAIRHTEALHVEEIQHDGAVESSFR